MGSLLICFVKMELRKVDFSAGPKQSPSMSGVVQFENTPKAFANFSSTVGASSFY